MMVMVDWQQAGKFSQCRRHSYINKMPVFDVLGKISFDVTCMEYSNALKEVYLLLVVVSFPIHMSNVADRFKGQVG